MKRVLVDCDGVLADFISRVCETIEFHGGGKFMPDQVTEFNFAKALQLGPFLASAVKKTISNEPGWWSSLRPFPEAVDGVARLQEIAEVYVITAPWNSCKTWLHDREAWLKKHFGIPHSHVLVGSAKHLVSGDLFVDDKTDALHAWNANQGGIAVQWQTPHNRLDALSGHSTRSWDELIGWGQWQAESQP